MSFERHDVVVTYSIVDANSSKSIEAFGQRLKNIQDRLNKFHNGIGRVSKVQNDAGRKLTFLERTFKAFNKTIGNSNMKLFGLYFALGRISQGLWGLMQPAMDAYGIFDYWQIMLTDLFIPVIDDLYGSFDALMGVIMDLPEPVKKFIGYFTLFLAIATSVTAAIIGLKLAMWALAIEGGAAATALSFIGGAAMIAGIVVLSGMIMDMQEKMGGWGELTKSVLRGMVRGFGALAHLGVLIFGNMVSIIGDKFMGLVEWVRDLANAVPGAGWVAELLNAPIAAWASQSSKLKQGAIFGENYDETAPEWLENMMAESWLAPKLGYAENYDELMARTAGSTGSTALTYKLSEDKPRGDSSVIGGLESVGISSSQQLQDLIRGGGDSSVVVTNNFVISTNEGGTTLRDAIRRAQDEALLGYQRAAGGV